MGMELVGIHWRYVSNTNTARRGKTVSIRGLRQSIETQMRRRILEAIEVVPEEELTEALGTGR